MKKTINCPKCAHSIIIEDVLFKQLSQELEKTYENKLLEKQKELEVKMLNLEKEKELIEKQKEETEVLIKQGVKKGLSVELNLMEDNLRKQINQEKASELTAYKEQLQLKANEVKDLYKTKAQLETLKLETEQLKDKIESEVTAKFSTQLNEEKTKIRREVENNIQLKISEKDYLIDGLKEQMKVLNRKLEQSSMQAQGEVQELAIEDWLKNNFPLDQILEIGKGVRGADCLHIVNTRNRLNIGSIYVESKRCKDFQSAWIEKFKADLRERNATFGVIVTDVLPKDMQRMGQKEGIWICTLQEFQGLSFVLRESVVMLSDIVLSQENKGEKTVMLYDYLIGSEFRLQIEAIVEGFVNLNNDLQSEMRSMNGIWKKRQKQIEKVLLNTTHIYSTIRGIAGDSVKSIPALELPEPKIKEVE